MFELSYFTGWLWCLDKVGWLWCKPRPKACWLRLLTKVISPTYYIYIYIIFISLFIYLLIYLFIHDCHKGPLAPGLLAAILSVSSWKSPASPISKWYSSVRQGFMNDPLFASILVLLCSIFLSYGHFHLGRFNKYMFSTSFRSKENSKI